MKTTIIAATGNKNKIKEISAILSDFDSLELVDMASAGVNCEIEENGATFEENAKIKARTVARLTGKPAIADDSGLCVDALDGRPGIYSARYASENGENAKDSDNNSKLLRELAGIPSGERTARYVAAVALVFPDGREYCAIGVCEGVIASQERGSGGFGYDTLFYCPQLAKTYAELSSEEKNKISHRGKALCQLKKILETIEL